MDSPEKTSYVKFEATKKLGDRAFSAKQYEKAIEYYEKALQFFNIPNHPKYLAVLEDIRKAKKELTIKSGNFQPKGYVLDGIIKPLVFHIRYYSNRQLPENEWEIMVIRALDASLEINPQLKKTVEISGSNSEVHKSWEYVPYFDEAFKNVAENRGQTFFESLVASSNPKLCRLFSSDIAFSGEHQTKGMIVVVVFGNEMV